MDALLVVLGKGSKKGQNRTVLVLLKVSSTNIYLGDKDRLDYM